MGNKRMRYNLLTDPFVPVVGPSGERIYKSVLEVAKNNGLRVVHTREDYECGFEKLLSNIFQIDAPADVKEQRERIVTSYSLNLPLECMDWFVAADLNNENTPLFMQAPMDLSSAFQTTLGKSEIHEIGKTHPGNDGRKHHVDRGYRIVCPSCAVIGLYLHQTEFTPGGQGYKYPLRKPGSLSTTIHFDGLRETAWGNVLPKDFEDKANTNGHYSSDEKEKCNSPTWIVPQAKLEAASTVGLVRGLLWTAYLARIVWDNKVEGIECDCCGEALSTFGLGAVGVRTTCSAYKDLSGVWVHPFSPYTMEDKKDDSTGLDFRFYPKRSDHSMPVWAQLLDVFPERERQSDWKKYNNVSYYSMPALVVQNAKRLGGGVFKEGIPLSVGGYQTDQAKLERRRHERISLSSAMLDNHESTKEDSDFLYNVRTVASTGKRLLDVFSSAVFSLGRIIYGEGASVKSSIQSFQRKVMNDVYSKTEYGMRGFVFRASEISGSNDESGEKLTELVSEVESDLKKALTDTLEDLLNAHAASRSYGRMVEVLTGFKFKIYEKKKRQDI